MQRKVKVAVLELFAGLLINCQDSPFSLSAHLQSTGLWQAAVLSMLTACLGFHVTTFLCILRSFLNNRVTFS